MDLALRPAPVVVVAAGQAGPGTEAMLAVLRRAGTPGTTWHLLTDASRQDLAKLAPYTAALAIPETGARAYVLAAGGEVREFGEAGELARFLQDATN